MRNQPVLDTDLIKQLLKALPDPEMLPDLELIVPYQDALTKEERKIVFQKRTFMNNGKEEKYWVSMLFLASKGVK